MKKQDKKWLLFVKKPYICVRINPQRMKDNLSKGFISHKYLNIKKRDGFAF